MTEASPRISAICAFLNAERFIEQTIESVLGQDFEDYELLLINDGSSDGSSAIARRYARAHSHVRYLEHADHANLGTTASRNAGLRAARGELVAFIDADDVWRPSKLREQAAILERLPEVDAVCGAVNFWASHAGGEDKIIPTGHVQNRVVQPTEGLRKIYPLGRADPPCPSDLLMRRSIVERIGGFEETFVAAAALRGPGLPCEILPRRQGFLFRPGLAGLQGACPILHVARDEGGPRSGHAPPLPRMVRRLCSRVAAPVESCRALGADQGSQTLSASTLIQRCPATAAVSQTGQME